MLLAAGYLGDRLGRKNVFLGGMILFGSGSGLLTLMPTFETMFAARVVQGVGAAFISANGGVLAVSVLPWNQRGQVLGIIGAAVALGLKAGPVVGGFLAITLAGARHSWSIRCSASCSWSSARRSCQRPGASLAARSTCGARRFSSR
jgi:MFS family permease